MNAVGESAGAIGEVMWADGAASKVISSAGGKLFWRSGAITFANAATTFRVGIQDVDLTTGLEDGTFDTHDDLIGGTDTIAASAWQSVTLSVGTKTLAAGDLIAVVLEMTTRGGADSVVVARTAKFASALIFPYGSVDISALAKTGTVPFVLLIADDGTVGWLRGMSIVDPNGTTVSTYNSGSTPDEYVSAFTPTVPVQVSAIGVRLGTIATTDAFDLILYHDPFGTPSALVTIAHDPDLVGNTSSGPFPCIRAITPTTLTAGVQYGIGVRPTTVNDIALNYIDFTAGFEAWKKTLPFGSSLKVGSRTDQSGAFTETQVYHLLPFYLAITGLSDGGGAAGTVIGQSVRRSSLF